MNLWLLLCAAVLLSLERLCYAWIWRAPEAFRALCHRVALVSVQEPIHVVHKLFYGFKGIQAAVFVGWCYVYGHGALLPFSGDMLTLACGGTLIVAGQMLNLSVFYQLGKVGVFYGKKFGYEISWCQAFPFSLLKHPQYIGTVLSIWGFFLIMRFPHDDWYLLPALETGYYMVGAYVER